jgi:cytochrome b-561 domain-containing protein 2
VYELRTVWFVDAGYGVIFYSKWERKKPHLASWHGMVGLATVIYIVLQCCGGLNLLYPQLAMRIVRLASLKQLHATSALVLCSLVAGALLTGMASNWFTATVTGTSWYACAVCPVLMLVIVANQVKTAYLPQQ